MVDDIIEAIFNISNEAGLSLVVNESNWDGGEYSIGIPPKKQRAKRKIWRAFFWIRPKKNEITFYAPNHPSIRALKIKYDLDLWEETKIINELPENTLLLIASLNSFDTKNPKHLEFIRFIIDTRRAYLFK